MNIRLRQVNDITVVAIVGEVNRSTAPSIQDQLLPLTRPGCKILLDMSAVTYLSSAGLRLLLLLYRQIAANNGRVVLTGLSEMIRDTMAITGFLDFFVTYETLEEGLTALSQAGEGDNP